MASDMVSEHDVIEQFTDYGYDIRKDSEILMRVVHSAMQKGLSADDIAVKWSTFAMNSAPKITPATVKSSDYEKFLDQLDSAMKPKAAKKNPPSSLTRRVNDAKPHHFDKNTVHLIQSTQDSFQSAYGIGVASVVQKPLNVPAPAPTATLKRKAEHSDSSASVFQTPAPPARSKQLASMTSTPPASTYVQRKNKGEVVESFAPQAPAALSGVDGDAVDVTMTDASAVANSAAVKNEVRLDDDAVALDIELMDYHYRDEHGEVPMFRYMYETEEEKRAVLEEQISQYADYVRNDLASSMAALKVLDDLPLDDFTLPVSGSSDSAPSGDASIGTSSDDPAADSEKKSALAVDGAQLDDGMEFSSLSRPSQDPILVCGRVVIDPSEGAKKLDRTSIMLEGDMAFSSGARVKLDVSELKEFFFFPGQMLSLRGINASGTNLVAQSLAQAELLPSYNLPLQVKSQFKSSARTVRLVVAAGPFTLADRLNFTPLQDLLELVRRDKPDVLVLLGPFVDASHKQISKGDLGGHTFQTLFMHLLRDFVVKQLRFTKTQVMLVPAVTDHHHECVFPQPPFSLDADALRDLDAPVNKLRFLPNPAILRVNDVTIALSSLDALTRLASEGYEKRQPETDRISRLMQHFIDQRSFYPLLPVADGDCVDYTFASQFSLPFNPDILVMPSKLQRFVRKLRGGCVAINPESLTKMSSAGTYAKITISPAPSDFSTMADRVQVDIVRL